MSFVESLRRVRRADYVRLCQVEGQCLPLRIHRCESFICRLRGLMFRRQLRSDDALLFVQPNEARWGSAIHMFFVFFSIGVVWLRGDGVVVDTALAKPFRPFYMPRKPARCFIEGPPSILSQVSIGDQLYVKADL